MKEEDVIKKLRELKLQFIQEKIGTDPSRLHLHLGEFVGYATFLYEFWANVVRQYAKIKADVTKEEYARKDEYNAKPGLKPSERITVAETEARISQRIADLQTRRDYLEIECKGVTLHINSIQTLLRAWGDEAKGNM